MDHELRLRHGHAPPQRQEVDSDNHQERAHESLRSHKGVVRLLARSEDQNVHDDAGGYQDAKAAGCGIKGASVNIEW